MSVGYACLIIGVEGVDLKSCVLKSMTEESLRDVIRHNLCSLKNMIRYNAANGIRLFRISSDLIPFGSHPANTIPWRELFADDLREIGEEIKKYGIRVSMHPGQYTVLNSPRAEVVERAADDLRYHASVLEALGTGTDCKIVLHLGGVYDDRDSALSRFEDNFFRLKSSVRDRIIIENDERCYPIREVLEFGRKLKIPVVFDNLHHAVNPSEEHTAAEWIAQCADTWKQADGRQKIHYSQQAKVGKTGAHSETIDAKEFLRFYESLTGKDIDIMLEVKDKNLSAVKIQNCILEKGKIGTLEQEWSRYKYTVLEHCPTAYQAIRELLKEKNGYPAAEFYELIDQALALAPETGHAANAALHVWGYLKQHADEREKRSFLGALRRYEEGDASLQSVKNQLYRLNQKYRNEYLESSLYFTL